METLLSWPADIKGSALCISSKDQYDSSCNFGTGENISVRIRLAAMGNTETFSFL